MSLLLLFCSLMLTCISTVQSSSCTLYGESGVGFTTANGGTLDPNSALYISRRNRRTPSKNIDPCSSSEIPKDIGLFKKVTTLDLSFGRFIGDIPTEIGEMENLEFMYLYSFNYFESLPTQIGKLQNLKVLSLDDGFNKSVSISIPAEIGNLEKLTTISFSGNELSGSIPSTVGRLDKLKHFGVLDSNLTGTIPEFSNSLNNITFELSGNRFQLDCECELLSWYPTFAENNPRSNFFDIGACSDVNGYRGQFPHQIKQDPSTPCSYSIVEDKMDTTSTSIKVGWTSTEPVSNPAFTFNESVLEVGRYTSANVVSSVSDADLLREYQELLEVFKPKFRACDVSNRNTSIDDYQGIFNRDRQDDATVLPTFVNSIGDEVQNIVFRLLGFEISWTDVNGLSDRICVFPWEVKAENQSGLGPTEMSLSITDLNPFTEYDIIIRSIYVDFQASLPPQMYARGVGINYGIESSILKAKTLDGIPVAGPSDITSPSIRDNEITLSWTEPSKSISNGDIIEYEIKCQKCDSDTVKTSINVFTFSDLESDQEYTFQIRARTSAGYGPFSDPKSVTTCPKGTKQTEIEAECVAIRGNFLLASESFNCEVEFGSKGILAPGSCVDEGLTVERLELLPGFWRPNVEKVEIRKCPETRYCSKERSSSAEPEGGRILGSGNVTAEEGQCALYHRGTYCMFCDESYALTYQSGCIECSTSEVEDQNVRLSIFYLTIAIIGVGFPCYFFLRTRFSVQRVEKSDNQNCCADTKTISTLSRIAFTKFTILAGFLQVLFAFQVVLYPDAEVNLFEAFLKLLVTANLASMVKYFRVDCLLDRNHYTNLLLNTIPVLVLVFILVACYMIVLRKRPSWKREALKCLFSMLFFISTLIYPGTSKAVLDTFICEDFDSIENDDEDQDIYKSILRVDYVTSCAESAERTAYLVYASLMVIVFPVGILVFYGFILRNTREKNIFGLSRKGTTKEGRETYIELARDLTFPYKEEFFWFELWELIRKLLLTSFISLSISFLEGNEENAETTAQTISLNISLFFLVVLAYLQPYCRIVEQLYASLSLLLLVLATQFTRFLPPVCDIDCESEMTGIMFLTTASLGLALFFISILIDYTLHFRQNAKTDIGSTVSAADSDAANIQNTL